MSANTEDKETDVISGRIFPFYVCQYFRSGIKKKILKNTLKYVNGESDM